MRRLVWEMYFGDSRSSGLCPLCNKTLIAKDLNSGQQDAHIISRQKLYRDQVKESKYYIIPSCAACNNLTGTHSVFDYLWCLERSHQLRTILKIIYTTYLRDYEDSLPAMGHERMIWNVLESLYGKQRFPLSGGGITNAKPIYEFARTIQGELLREEATRIAKESLRVATLMEQCWAGEIKF